MLGYRAMRWLLTLHPMPTRKEPPEIEELLPGLREQAREPALRCAEQRSGGFVLVLDSPWKAYERLFAAAQPGRRLSIGGFGVARIEPAFTPGYLYQVRKRDEAVMNNFAMAYGPVCKGAALHARRQFGNHPGLPDLDELMGEIWNALMGKLERLLESFDESEGSQKNWIFVVAYRDAISALRKHARSKEDLKELHQLSPAQSHLLAQTPELAPDEQVLLNQLAHAFELDCQRSQQRTRPDDWELFQALFLERRSQEEICADYKLEPDYFYVRFNRLKNRLKKVYAELLQRENQTENQRETKREVPRQQPPVNGVRGEES